MVSVMPGVVSVYQEPSVSSGERSRSRLLRMRGTVFTMAYSDLEHFARERLEIVRVVRGGFLQILV